MFAFFWNHELHTFLTKNKTKPVGVRFAPSIPLIPHFHIYIDSGQ